MLAIPFASESIGVSRGVMTDAVVALVWSGGELSSLGGSTGKWWFLAALEARDELRFFVTGSLLNRVNPYLLIASSR
jgi:hypothetical protein